MSKRATLRQIAAIVTTLEEVIVQFSPGKCYYKENYSDSELAKPHGLHPAHVGRIRRDMFGELVKPPKPVESEPIDRLTELEARVNNLEAAFLMLGQMGVSHGLVTIDRIRDYTKAFAPFTDIPPMPPPSK